MGWNDHLDIEPEDFEDYLLAVETSGDLLRKMEKENRPDGVWYCPLCKPGEPCDKHKRGTR